jgi:uncharacterized protein YbbC (DUF1343 family)
MKQTRAPLIGLAASHQKRFTTLGLAAAWLLLYCFPTAPSTRAAEVVPVSLGSEVLASSGFSILQGKRVGLITNPSGLNSRGKSTIDLLRRAPGVRLVALLAPEHGLRGEFKAGKEFPNSTDPNTGLPIYSLYGPGPTRRPTPAMLSSLDALVYDIQDTGCRSYTYISTMGLAMEACAEAKVRFVVLDRPNPLGGLRVEGPMLDPRFKSFVGQWPIPYVYGMTTGELARMINGERWIAKPCSLTVVTMKGWKRAMTWRDTGLNWVATSPNVPRGTSPLYQVATGMLGEIGGLHIGMGSTYPFELLAAPWLDARKFADALRQFGLPGLTFTPCDFTPSTGLYHGQLVHGVRVTVTDRALAPLTAMNYYTLEAVRKSSGRDLFAEAVKAGRTFSMFDKVNGTDQTRLMLQAGKSASLIVQSWKQGEDRFRARRKPYLIY